MGQPLNKVSQKYHFTFSFDSTLYKWGWIFSAAIRYHFWSIGNNPNLYPCHFEPKINRLPESVEDYSKQPPLAIRHRIKFKTAVLVYKCLHSMAPPYLASYCTLVTSQTGRSNLQSATTGQLIVPGTRTAYSSRSFVVHVPVVWNSLPAELQSPGISLDVFRKQLKTFLFNCWFAEFSNLGYINVINNNIIIHFIMLTYTPTYTQPHTSL